MARTASKPAASQAGSQCPSPCQECCGHGVALVWFCAYCAELEEFGSSDFGVWGPEMAMLCEHSAGVAS